MKKEKCKKRSLRRSILRGCAMFCAVQCFVMGTIGAVNYYRGMMKNYRTYLEGILRYVITEVDGDDMKACLETGTPSEKYQQTQSVLDRIKDNCQIDYIYIVKPLNTDERNNMMGVMAGASSYEKQYEADEIEVLGVVTDEEYSAKVAEKYLSGMNAGGSVITYFRNITEYGDDYTGMMPVLDSQGEPVGLLAVDISIDEIWQVLFRYTVIILIGMAVLVLVLLASLYQWLNKRVVLPVSRIQQSAKKFVEASRGQDDPEQIPFDDPDIHSGDEIQALSESLSSMASDLKHYMKNLMQETREKQRIGTELELAAKIQADMLPCIFPAFPERREFEIYATMNPAKEVGGDFYDFFMVDDTHLAVVMADVSGKGVPAALFMVIGKTLIKDHTQPGKPLGEVFTEVNNLLCDSNSEGLFITAFEGVLDLETGEFRYVNAGHEAPFLCRKGGLFEQQKLRRGFVLAGMEDMQYREGSLTLGPGDRIFLFTDGVTEATSLSEELYGRERLGEALNRNAGMGPEGLLRAVKADVDAFVGEAPQFDDITMLCVDFKG